MSILKAKQKMQMKLSPRAWRRWWAGLLCLAAQAVFAASPVSTGWLNNLAVSGYDPVAYFTVGAPTEGKAEFEYQWSGATWRFVSAANRDQFAAHPETYAPQFGGYCAWAIAQGKTAPSDPIAWRIVDGKLYLNYDVKIQSRWEQDINQNIHAAERHWPDLIE